MTTRATTLALPLACLALAGPARATPVLGEPLPAGPLRVYADDQDPAAFYYPPGPLAVAEAPDGGPELRFLQLVYVGTDTAGDAGRFLARSSLSFRVLQLPVPAQDLAAARAALPAGARLRALPIRRTLAELVFTPLGADAAGARPLGAGRLEEPDAPASAPAVDPGTWSERLFVLAPDAYTSQFLWDAFQRGRVALSFGWTHHADGLDRGPGRLSATPGVVLADATRPEAAAPGDHVVGSGATAVEVDARRFPDRLRRLDLNQAVPPSFAALEVRCYDFDNALRPDLSRKSVEVRATGVGGRTLLRSVSFRAEAPDLAVATLRFSQAVRLDRPFAWRTVEVDRAGLVTVSGWTPRADWIPVLDVTSPPEARPARTPSPEDAP